MSSQYATAQSRCVELQRDCMSASEDLSALTSAHANTSDRLEAIQEQLAAKSEKVSDSGPLQNIRKSKLGGDIFAYVILIFETTHALIDVTC